MQSRFEYRRDLIKELNSKEIFAIGKNDERYQCVIGGYDKTSYLLFIKGIDYNQYFCCFDIKIVVHNLFKSNSICFNKSRFTLVNNDFNGYTAYCWCSFSEFDSRPLNWLNVITFDIF